MAPILVKSLNRLSREAIIDLALKWLQDGHTSSPYLLCNCTGIEANEEDYQHTPAESIEDLRKWYRGLRNNTTQAPKRDVVDRIVDGDWRRGLSLHQHAMIDFAYLEQNDTALRWSALKVVPLEIEGQKSFDNDSSGPAKKKRKLSHNTDATYPQVSPQAFLSTLKAEISPLVKAHYHLHRMPSPYNLTILRLYISPTSSFAPRRSKTPRRAKHATDTGRIVYIALPDSCPHVYISISGSSSTTSNSRSKGSARDAKQKVMAKVDIAAMKRIVLEAIPKALSRPLQRWALESTKLVARSLKTMCDLRGNQKPGTGGGAYSVFVEGGKVVDNSPIDVQTIEAEAEPDNERYRLIEQRFGHMHGSRYAALDRVHVKLTHIPPLNTDEDDTSIQTSEQEEAGIFLTFSGSDVFGGLKTLAQLGPQYIDVENMPAWMTGELGVSNLTV